MGLSSAGMNNFTARCLKIIWHFRGFWSMDMHYPLKFYIGIFIKKILLLTELLVARCLGPVGPRPWGYLNFFFKLIIMTRDYIIDTLGIWFSVVLKNIFKVVFFCNLTICNFPNLHDGNRKSKLLHIFARFSIFVINTFLLLPENLTFVIALIFS